MQITDNIRKEITLSLPKLGMDEVTTIAKKCSVGIHTVYRELRKLKGIESGNSDLTNPVVIELLELSIERKKEKKAIRKRLERIEKQFSQEKAA